MIASHTIEPQGDPELIQVRQSLRALCGLLQDEKSLETLAAEPSLFALINRLDDYAKFGAEIHTDGDNQLMSGTFIVTPDGIQNRVSSLLQHLDDADSFNNLAAIVRGNGWRETIQGVRNLSDILCPTGDQFSETVIKDIPVEATGDFIAAPPAVEASVQDPRLLKTVIGSGEPKGAVHTIDDMPLRRLEDSLRLVPNGVIGRGGMGMVIKAYDDNIGGNVVALKICTSNDAQQHARFSTEIKISGSLLGVNQAVGATGAYITTEEHQIEHQGKIVTIPKNSRCFTTPYIAKVSTLEDMLNFYHALLKGVPLDKLTEPPQTLRTFLSENQRTLDGAKIDQSFATLTDNEQRERKNDLFKQFVDFERRTLFPVEYFNLRDNTISSKDFLNKMQKRLIETLADAARVVHELHSRGIVHRDLKPANILVSPTGVPYIIDFGLARKLQAQEINEWSSDDDLTATVDENLTQPGRLMGTPSCMAPEQIIGDPTLVSKSLDIYAFGAMLYYLYSGQTQLGELDGTQNAFLNAVANVRDGKVKAPSRYGSNRSEGLRPSLGQIISDTEGWSLQEIIKHAMHLDSKERHHSILDLVYELDDWRNGYRVDSALSSSKVTPLEKRFYSVVRSLRANPGRTIKTAAAITAGFGLGTVAYSAASDRADAVNTAQSAQRSARALDPDSVRLGLERTIEAQGKIAPWRLDPLPYVWSAFSGQETSLAIINSARRHLETRAEMHEEFLLPAYDAIAGASNDFGTSRGNNDKGRKNLQTVLDAHIKGHDHKGGAAAFVNYLTSLELPPEELREYRQTTRDLLLRYAFKIPYHPTNGFNDLQAPHTVLHYIEEARSISEESMPATVGELLLARRAWKALKNMDEIGRIDEKLSSTQPASVFDFSILSKHLLSEKKDTRGARRMYQQGIDVADALRREYLTEHRDAQARRITIESIGIRLGYANALKTDRDLVNSLAQLTACKVLAETLEDSETANQFYSIALTQEAIITKRLAGTTGEAAEKVPLEAEEQIRTLYRTALHRSPGASSLITYLCWAEFERVQGHHERAISICNDALSFDSTIDPILSERALSEAYLGQRDNAIASSCKVINLYLRRSEKHTDIADVNSFESILNLWETHREIFDEMNVVPVARLAAALSVSSGKIMDEQIRLQQIALSFEMMEHLVSEAEKQEGYGRNAINIVVGHFTPLKEHDLERYDALAKKREQLPSNKPLIGIF